MDGLLLLVRLLLSATFAVAGITKAADPAGTRQSILDFGAPGALARPVAWLLPLAELACAVALLPAAWAVWGAAGTLALLLLFIAVIGISLIRGRRPACHCFGQLHSEPVGLSTIARNVVLSGMAGLVILEAREMPSPSYMGWLSGLGRFEAAVWAFSLAVAVLAALWIWSLLHLLRQNGRLLLRLEAVEAELGLRGDPPPPGLPVDTPAPPFRVAALDGSMVTLDTLRQAGDSLLLIFTEPGCGGCDALMPHAAEWQQAHADRLSIALISRGSLETNRAKAAEYRLRNFLLQVDEETSSAYHAEGVPTAVLIRKGLIASPVASGAEAIHELVAKAAAPPPLAKGELAPEITLPDLNGEAVDLRELRGRRHLLLFWNPDCGYCQAMLADIKSWERDAADDAPRLVVVSTGAPEANRAQGFRAPMVLDHGFRTGELFGATGTPSAVVLDEAGRVASVVGVGAEEVLALARGTVGKSEILAVNTERL
jgi:peroxiredoxin